VLRPLSAHSRGVVRALDPSHKPSTERCKHLSREASQRISGHVEHVAEDEARERNVRVAGEDRAHLCGQWR